MDKIRNGIKEWIHLNILLLLLLFIVRIIFFIETATRINTPVYEFVNIILGYKYDLILVSHFIAWMSLLFLALYYFIPKIAIKVYKVLIFIYAIASTLLTEYFCNMMMPLDHVIFAYSAESLKDTIKSSASFSIVPIIYIIISTALFAVTLRLWNKVKIGNVVSYLFLGISLIVSVSFDYGKIIRNEYYADSHSKFILTTNQFSYSFVKIYDYFIKEDSNDNTDYEVIEQAVRSYHKKNSRYEYPYLDYPFYRKADYQDVLGSFFNKTQNGEKPNIVFVIVESLGQCLTGVEKPTISFTPFLDSLKNEGLYWKNCLAVTERTFGVLPSIFASTPHGEKGFANRYRKTLTDHNSLLKDLNENDYDISYYYGCYRDLDRYDNFLKYNDIEKIFIPESGNVDEEIYNMMTENNRWGIDDKELFEIAVRNRKQERNDNPFVDIFMTLSTHEPFFILNGQEKYEQMAKTILDNNKNVSKNERNIILKDLYAFAAYLYIDECIRYLIDSYKEMGKYDNTIFIITGDHRTGAFKTGNELRSYNVPLLIFSPLLKEKRQMDAVVSHYDITPTINAYLSNNYDFNVDEYCHWIGTELDTTKHFRSVKTQAFMLNNRDVVEYLDKEYFLCRDKLYKIDNNLCLTPIEYPYLQQCLKKELDDYNMISKYAIEMNFLNHEEDAFFVDIAEYHFDIDNSSDKIHNKLIVDSLDNKFVYFDESREFISLYPYLKFKEDYNKLIVSVSFDMQSYTGNELPTLVYKIGDFYKSVPLVSLQGESLNTGKLEHFVNKVIISNANGCKDETLKIYLWNSSKGRMMFDNIDVLIKASK